MGRLDYYRRIFPAYLSRTKSQLTFWHDIPAINENSTPGELGEYYMPFFAKADYPGYYDDQGIPMLDYHGAVGLQYNPIAIAQYGLGNYNLFCRTGDRNRRSVFMKIAEWLVENLEQTPEGTRVWYHHFNWEYRDKLRAPWYSALAQGQGISLLVRAHKMTQQKAYLQAAAAAFETFKLDMRKGGVVYTDGEENIWFEEYIVFPPTHILNGFIWAIWGVYDYFLATGDPMARRLFDQAIQTLKTHIRRYDLGFWSLYELSGTKIKMIASHFYHHLHVVQLDVLHRLTGDAAFRHYVARWERFRRDPVKRFAALAYKALFKLLYY